MATRIHPTWRSFANNLYTQESEKTKSKQRNKNVRKKRESRNTNQRCDMDRLHMRQPAWQPCTLPRVKGWAAVQKDLDKLEEWDNRNLKKFHNYKSKVLHQGRNNAWLLCRLDLCQKGPGALGRQQTEHEPAGCPGSREGQLHAGMCSRSMASKQIEGSCS